MTTSYQLDEGWLDWGQLAKLPDEEQVEIVRMWLASHQPHDKGYPGALRWLSRRDAMFSSARQLADGSEEPKPQRKSVEIDGDVWAYLERQKAVNTYRE